MTRNRYQVWTSDMVIGAAIVIIGFVAMLVHSNIIELRWIATPPPMVTHLWPLLLIGTGFLMLFDREDHRDQKDLRAGERQ